MEPNAPEITSAVVKTSSVVIGWLGSVGGVLVLVTRKYSKLEGRVDALERRTPEMCSNNQIKCKLEQERNLEKVAHEQTTAFNASVADINQKIALMQKDIKNICDVIVNNSNSKGDRGR